MYKVSETANRLVALISNSKELAVHHQQKQSAINVLKAARVLAETKQFQVDLALFDVLMDSVRDKGPMALKEAYESLENKIVATDLDEYMRIETRNIGGLDDPKDSDQISPSQDSADFLYVG